MAKSLEAISKPHKNSVLNPASQDASQLVTIEEKILKPVVRFLILLTVFLTPIVPSFFGFGYELIKVLIFLILTIISGLIFVFLVSAKRITIRWTKTKITALLFLLLLTITSVIGINPYISLTGNYPYYQGLVLYWFLFLFFLISSETKIAKKGLINAIVFSALAVSGISIIQSVMQNFLNIEIPNYAGRVVSTFGQPNLYSGFLLFSLPFASQLKFKKYLVILIIATGIILSFSKAAIILLFALSLIWLFKKFKKKGALIFLALVFLLNALVFSLGNSSGIIWDEVLRPLSKQGTESHTVEKRIYIIPIMLDIYSKSPVLGFGVDSINNLYRAYFADFKPELKNYPPLYFNLMNLTIDRSHNYFLDLLIFSGLPGLLAYLYLLFLLFKSRKPEFLKIFLILYLIWIQFQVQSIVHLMLFWLAAGAIDNKENFVDDGY